MTQKKKEKEEEEEEEEAGLAVVVLSLMVAQGGDVAASSGGSSFFLFYFSAFILPFLFLYLFHFVLLWFFFCSSFTLLSVSVLFCSSRLQYFFLSPTNSLLYVCLYCFPLCSPSFTSLPLLCFLLQNCPVHPPLYNLTCFPPSPPVEGGIYRGRGSGSYPTPISDEDRVRWLSRPLCSCLEPPAGHTSHAPPMMVAGHEGHGFILGFRQVGRERERENVGEQNFLFSCCTSRGRRSTVPFKTTLFCAFFNEQCMKRRCFVQNVLFHLKGNDVKNMKNSKSVLNL